MNLYIEAHLLLIKAEDMPGTLCAWCPELDVMSQGDSVQAAIAMAYEACRMTIEADLYPGCMGSEYNVSEDFEVSRVRQRIRHPLRRGLEPAIKDDPHHPFWEMYCGPRAYGSTTAVTDTEFEAGPDAVGITTMNFEVSTMCGLVFVNGPMRCYTTKLRVPATEFRVQYTETFEREMSVWVSASDLENADDPLVVVTDVIKSKLGQHGGFGHRGQMIAVKSVKSKHPLPRPRFKT